MSAQLRIGTRKSKLALAQTDLVCAALRKSHGPNLNLEIVKICSSGDKTQKTNEPLIDLGGKGLFIKELEDALREGQIDVAVHSVKDIPGIVPCDFDLVAYLPRADIRDVFLSHTAECVENLPEGAVIGTCSPRRQAQMLARRPDLEIVTFRGNVETRLQKLADGEVDATLLAACGLKRLGLISQIKYLLEPDIMIPAIGQGAIGLEIRQDDAETRRLVSAVNHYETMLGISAERAMLSELDGDCHSPIAGYAVLKNSFLTLKGLVARIDGSDIRTETMSAKTETTKDAINLGQSVAHQLKKGLPEGFFK